MKPFVITTETNSDLPDSYLKEHEIGIIPHYYEVEGEVYGDGKELSVKEFYNKMRAGKMPTTMASNPAVIHDTFEHYVSQGLDVLHISFSSALSGGYSNVSVGAREICEEDTNAKIIVFDTLNVSLGEGLAIMKAVELRDAGKSIEETADWLTAHRQNFCVRFTVDDLFHLQRGGRLSKATAIVGTMINIKPILRVDEKGALVPMQKARGRKKSLVTLVDLMLEAMGDYRTKKEPIGVVHGDVPEEAKFVAALIRERLGGEERQIIINSVGPSIGAHSGPGAIGICFLGEQR